MKKIEFKKLTSANGMEFKRIDKVWDYNINGSIWKLANSVGDKIINRHPLIVGQTNGYLQTEIFETLYDMLYKYGMRWGRIWNDSGIGTLIKKDNEWIIQFDKDDEDWLFQTIVNKYK